MKHTEILELLDAAKQQLGSDYKVCKALEISTSVVSDWRHARKNPQPEDIALIASLAGMDGATWALRALVEKHEGTPKGDRLMKAVGKAFLVTGAAIGGAGANAGAIFGSTYDHVGYLIRCIFRSPRAYAAGS